MADFNQNIKNTLFKCLTLLSCFIFFLPFNIVAFISSSLLYPLEVYAIFWDKLNYGKWFGTCYNVPEIFLESSQNFSEVGRK